MVVPQILTQMYILQFMMDLILQEFLGVETIEIGNVDPNDEIILNFMEKLILEQ